jgi:outer membrane biosynthesis protein TonB
LRLDDELHRRAKVAAAREGVSLNAVLTDLLRRYVEQAEEEQPRPEPPERQKKPPASTPQQPPPTSPFQPPVVEEEVPPEPPAPAKPQYQSDLMRRMREQG